MFLISAYVTEDPLKPPGLGGEARKTLGVRVLPMDPPGSGHDSSLSGGAVLAGL